jgi:F0F1-type ATP synthase membrane subunit b/b'
MSPELANFVFEAANFLLFAGALGWLLFKPVRLALERECARREQETQAIERARGEAQASVAAARAERDAARGAGAGEAANIVGAARREADQLLSEARSAAAAAQRALERELEAARRAELDKLAADVGQLAARSVEQVLLSLSGPAVDAALLGAACQELSRLPREQLEHALVETARPLTALARTELEHVLGEHFEQRVVPELRAGARVTTAGGQVDASSLSLARAAARALAPALAPNASWETIHA